MLAADRSAPAFSLPDQSGATRSLIAFRGKPVVLYFYPKDDTPGCMMEACAIRDSFPDFGKIDAVVIGISADSVESHRKFAEKYNLPFILLSDPAREVITLYEANAGEGTKRVSYLLDREGKIVKSYEKVVPESHAAEVLQDLAAL